MDNPEHIIIKETLLTLLNRVVYEGFVIKQKEKEGSKTCCDNYRDFVLGVHELNFGTNNLIERISNPLNAIHVNTFIIQVLSDNSYGIYGRQSISNSISIPILSQYYTMGVGYHQASQSMGYKEYLNTPHWQIIRYVQKLKIT